MSDQARIRHILLAPVAAYGHVRPMCALAGRLAAQTSTVITLLMAPNYLQSAKSDIMAHFPAGHEALERIRIVSLFDSTETDMFVFMRKAIEHYPAAYETLHRGSAIKCATTGTEYAAVPPPAAIILDAFAIQQLHATRAVSGTKIPIFTYMGANAGTIIRLFCPESMGGRGDFGARIDAEALRVGKPADEIADEIFNRTTGAVIKVPGIPTMYDYEAFPQISADIPLTALHRSAYDMIRACDGIFLNTLPVYDGESLVAFEDWMKKSLNKSVYPVGPLLPPGYGGEQVDIRPTSNGPRDLEVKSFLDSMESKYGNKSVLFISFGTVFWPKREDQVEVLVDTLIEKQFPFILCHPSPFATVSDALSQKIKASGIAMAAAWAPQQYILTHPATGWFLTHCGHGGVFEALARGVPMICWPIEGDQPIGAVILSESLNVAFHLMEVRTGKGLQRLHSGKTPQGTSASMRAEFEEVIDQCRDTVGDEKRENVRRVQAEFAKAWASGGSSLLTLNEFFVRYLPA
ncbi:Glycosyltransferase family 1 protein [Mycena venus]|uniref:Glycosyltransferase family 1 protein n=1 Tax=Mycena venus TaxID=2733690 RepID=A0A8H6XKY7_9AGAR|nr:Glycosyltransferase family 1 protein [Mycena venus]